MRALFLFAGVVAAGGVGLAARGSEPAVRYKVAADLKLFPQVAPKEALASALRAIDLDRTDYLLAQLADPDWVDARVSSYEGGFAALVRETATKLDPGAVKLLRRFLKEGDFETLDATAVVRLKNVKDRIVRLRKIDSRWYLQSPYKP